MQNHDFIFSRRSIRKFIKGTIPNKDINEVILVKKENDKIIIDLLNKKKN